MTTENLLPRGTCDYCGDEHDFCNMVLLANTEWDWKCMACVAESNAKEKAEAEDYLCASCNGSGEGQYDGTRCSTCHGTGVEK